MMQIEVAVPTPLAQIYSYLAENEVPRGSRVLVPFGSRKVVGVALSSVPYIKDTSREFELKQIVEVIDPQPIYSATVLEIARWISTYYMHPIGEVLRSMLPASSTKVVREVIKLTAKGADERADESSTWGEILRAVFGNKRHEISKSAAKTKLQRLVEAGAVDAKIAKFSSLKRRELIDVTRGSSVRARKSTRRLLVAENGEDEPLPLVIPPATATQERVLGALKSGLNELDKTPVFLLHGITGAGKTEVYLRLIAEVLSRDDGKAQVLVLVPEISLTPQMTRIFTYRFAGLVAVVHSAMSDVDRWLELNRIRSGEAKILIGPRSAVFGPFQKLELIIVDEEHDSSYKQSSGLAYNGRDVAVLRGRLERALVVLGSATPSLESYQNALKGRYKLLEMHERATGRPLPTVEVIVAEDQPMSRPSTLIAAARDGKTLPALTQADAEISMHPEVVSSLRANLAAGRQAIVLVNRRGYAYYLFSIDEKKAVQCPNCSISMTLHSRSTVLRCHYCDFTQTVASVVRQRPSEKFVAIGYGSQKAEDALRASVPGARIVRLDSDAVTDREMLPRTLGEFRAGEIDILVGTQILAKGHDFPNVTLIVILEVDQLLGLPDFRAGERAFQLLVQAAGRAGRAEMPGRVLMQTMRPEHNVVAAAVRQDYAAFVEQEIMFRQAHAYPPFSRMIAIEFNSPDQNKLRTLCDRVEAWMEQIAQSQPDLVRQVRLLGPAVPPIETIRGRHRRQLIFMSSQIQAMRTLVAQFTRDFSALSGDVRMRIDVDPQSLI